MREEPPPVSPLMRLARAKLSLTARPEAARAGDHVMNPLSFPGQNAVDQAWAAAKPAAVLIGLIERPQGPTTLLTERAGHLRAHSGQIAFPGGKIDAQDSGPVDAALREAWEEIGLARDQVEPFGLLDPYLTGSGYRIIPVVAEIHAPFALQINPQEVADVFETPFAFLMNAENHHRRSRPWKGLERHFFAMPWENKYIWGVTAGILRNLYERLYS